MVTALWCVGWQRLCGALNVDGFVVRWMATLKRPSPAGEADEAEEAITGVTIE
jgi:hypothetical protein